MSFNETTTATADEIAAAVADHMWPNKVDRKGRDLFMADNLTEAARWLADKFGAESTTTRPSVLLGHTIVTVWTE